jgi:phosphatidyl-myo-inositol dimannoside synthase
MREDRHSHPYRIGLLASEACARGGVQSFMLRIAEVIGNLVEDRKVTSGYCISLNDTTKALLQHDAIPSSLHVWGANRSKVRFILHALFMLPRFDVLFVGHLGLAPLAHALRMARRVREYHVILHGIEAWKLVPHMDRRALLAARSIVATTRYTAEECAKRNCLPTDRFRIIPLCADERNVAPTPDFRLKGEFKLLCVARQDVSERYKGFEHIFKALVQLQFSHPNIHLNMVGMGDDHDRLKRVANDLGVGQQITFWGVLSNEDLAAAYRDCNAYVLPSRKEGFGIVFLEAMRHGKPCIGGNHGGTPDVIEHGKTGYLVEYGEVEKLAEYICTLAQDASLCHSMGRRAKAMVENRFSYQAFHRNYSELTFK